MPQAILIASIFEFTGALVLGNTNVDVIAGGIVDRGQWPKATLSPYCFAYGMMIVMWVGGIFQVLASRLQFNVSATHSVIGGIIGFGVAHRGSMGVFWVVDDATKFPPYKGLVPVVIAWFFSPVFSAIAAFTIFMLVRTFVLRTEHAVTRSYYVLPIAVFGTIWINTFFVCTKGAKAALDKEQWNAGTAAWVAAVVAGFFALVSICLIPFIMKRVEARLLKHNEEEAASQEKSQDPEKSLFLQDAAAAEEKAPETMWEKVSEYLAFSEVNLSKTRAAALLAENQLDEFDPTKAEQFNREAEFVFNYLQIVTAIAVIFAHGANEVGYATGPLESIWRVVIAVNKLSSTTAAPNNPYANVPALDSKVVPNYWIIFICAMGLVLGLTLYGGRLTWAAASKFVKLSASRGFSAELATAIVITVAAQYGLPTSSSQCITGGIIGVGCAEGLGGVNWKYFLMNFTGWIFTMFIMGITCGILYSMGTYAPLELNP